jgi:hypothetical protein
MEPVDDDQAERYLREIGQDKPEMADFFKRLLIQRQRPVVPLPPVPEEEDRPRAPRSGFVLELSDEEEKEPEYESPSELDPDLDLEREGRYLTPPPEEESSDSEPERPMVAGGAAVVDPIAREMARQRELVEKMIRKRKRQEEGLDDEDSDEEEVKLPTRPVEGGRAKRLRLLGDMVYRFHEEIPSKKWLELVTVMGVSTWDLDDLFDSYGRDPREFEKHMSVKKLSEKEKKKRRKKRSKLWQALGQRDFVSPYAGEQRYDNPSPLAAALKTVGEFYNSRGHLSEYLYAAASWARRVMMMGIARFLGEQSVVYRPSVMAKAMMDMYPGVTLSPARPEQVELSLRRGGIERLGNFIRDVARGPSAARSLADCNWVSQPTDTWYSEQIRNGGFALLVQGSSMPEPNVLLDLQALPDYDEEKVYDRMRKFLPRSMTLRIGPDLAIDSNFKEEEGATAVHWRWEGIEDVVSQDMRLGRLEVERRLTTRWPPEIYGLVDEVPLLTLRRTESLMVTPAPDDNTGITVQTVAIERLDAEALLNALGHGDGFDVLIRALLAMTPTEGNRLEQYVVQHLKKVMNLGLADSWLKADGKVTVPSAPNHKCTSVLVWLLFLALANPERIKERHAEALADYVVEGKGRAELAMVASLAARRPREHPAKLVLLGNKA